MKVSKLLVSGVIALTSLMASAQTTKELTIGNIYSPGGGSDAVVTALGPSLERQGYKLNKEFYKACSTAFDQVKDGKADFIIMGPAEISISGDKVTDRCPNLKSVSDDFTVATTTRTSSLYVCNSPKFDGATLAKVKEIAATGQKVKVGVTDSFHEFFVKEFFKTALPNAKYVILRYSGTSKVKVALKAGDIDLVVGSSILPVAVSMGGTCFASSMKTFNEGVPFYGDLVGSKDALEVEYFEILVGKKSTMTPEIKKALTIAFNSDEYAAAMKKLKQRHLGMGVGTPIEQTMAAMQAVDLATETK